MPVHSTIDGNKVNITISGRFDFSLHKEFRDSYSNSAAGSETELVTYIIPIKDKNRN